MDTQAFFSMANSGALYLLVGAILAFITIMCIVFIIKSWRMGLAMGMDQKVMRRTITSSVTFTLLPSISILLGVIALSGSLGVPVSWLRLSVVGSLQYELNVAEIAAKNIGMSGLKVAEMTGSNFTTIILVMTMGILGGCFCCLFLLKPYLKKMHGKPKAEKAEKAPAHPKAKPFGTIAISAMFIGLCSAYIASYIGLGVAERSWAPLLTALVSAAVMAIFEFFTVKKKVEWLDNFSVATSMLAAMAAIVLIYA